jgi:manganese transport protein
MQSSDKSLSEINETVKVAQTGGRLKRFLSFFGPAYLVSVGYMDPGNWATDLAGGSKYGYALLWVLLMSNMMALLLQSHSARLGIVRGRDLAQANREAYPRPINFMLYILAEIAVAATDLAEVLGMAIGIYLLTDLPIIYGVCITVLDTFLLLYLQRLGMRKMEAFIIGLVAVIALCFLYNVIKASPVFSDILSGFLPSLPDAKDLYAKKGITGAIPTDSALYLAIGIIGATIMPHNLYLHSALVQTRQIKKDEAGIRQALKFNLVDSTIALNLAFFVNAAILILAASVFFVNNRTDVAELKTAHELLPQILSSGITAKLFAIALIASGQSSTITGTLAGQIVMEGYLKLRINPWARRLITRLLAIVPAFLVILLSGESKVDSLLVLSQVILSMQLGFAIIPLIHFVSDKQTMGKFAIGPIAKIASWLVASILVFLNIKMLVETGVEAYADLSIGYRLLLWSGAALFSGLLLITIIYPLYSKNKKQQSIRLHPKKETLHILEKPIFNHIGVALDFTGNDEKVLQHALAQGNPNSTYIIIHIIESATAKLLGNQTQDFETQKDKEQLQMYVSTLEQRGIKAKGILGYRNRNNEIVRIVKEEGIDMLVLGSHGHKGVSDIIHGQTINSVRHQLDIPLLLVKV